MTRLWFEVIGQHRTLMHAIGEFMGQLWLIELSVHRVNDSMVIWTPHNDVLTYIQPPLA